MEYVKHLWRKARYSAFPRLIVDGLWKLGICIRPLYVFREGLSLCDPPELPEPPANCEVSFLGPDDMKTIAVIPGRNISEIELTRRLEEGKKCLGVTLGGELAAFTWCDLDEFDFDGYRFPLEDDEAYLFDAYTLVPFRGRGLAPFVRYETYVQLAALGRRNLYSYSDCFNTPAIKFKKKLKAKKAELRLYVGLFGRWRFSKRIKQYDIEVE